MKALKILAIAAAVAASGLVHASSHVAAAAPFTEAEVRKVDKEAGKVTLKHGRIENLDMAPMTMVFRVKEPAMLDKLKAGDKVRFRAEKVQGAFTVTELAAPK
jgi:Cu(I)/Ag(I) efflux system periplasmic protein CusF